MDSKKLHKKLLKYGTLVAAVAGISEADAGIIYTDEVPDFTGASGSQYLLDLNNDGTDDFRIWHNGSYNLYVSPLAAANRVLGSGGATFAYPFALTAGSPINAGAGTFYNNGFAGGFQSLNYGSCSFGNWCSVTDRYLGFEFQIAGNTHYGWARLDVNFAGNAWVVKDYAYEDVANTNINAGDFVLAVVADTANTVVGLDVANNGNGSDLEVSFNAGADETKISEYRIIAVKEDSIAGFNLSKASALAAANYTAVVPTGSPSYTQLLSAASLDEDGDPIASGIPYVIYVLSVADGVIATGDAMVSSANNVMLNTIADTTTIISALDVTDNSDASDLEVTFSAAANEATIGEYRVIIVKSSVANAEALTSASYEAVPATGASSYQGVFTPGVLDSDGDAIALGVPYNTFVLSYRDGVIANLNSLSSASASVTLNSPANSVQNSVASDVGDLANGTDLSVSFDAANAENNISSYRLIAVKDVSASAFTLSDAQNLSASSYKEVIPNGGPYTEVLNANQEDSDGDNIVIDQAYHIFILSVANGVGANVDNMNVTNATVTLNTPTNPAINVVGSDIADNLNASDAQIDFDAAINEAGIDEYRVMLVKASLAGSFDLAAATAVLPGNFTGVNTDGSASYTRIISAGGKDVDGVPIAQFEDYQAFVLSKSDGTGANLDALSSPSASFKLSSDTSTTTAINDVVFENSIAYFSSSNDILIKLSAELVSDRIHARLYNLLGKQLESAFLEDKTYTMHTPNLTNGVYLLVLESKKGATKTFKLIKK